MSFNTQQEVLDALREIPRGSARSEILSDEINRSLVLTTGASFVMFSGTVKDGKTIREKLSDIKVAVLNRRNSRTGKPDGLGTLGGLAERTNPFEFYHMSPVERMKLVGEKDDIILVDNAPILTKDINIICRNNLLREAREELADLGIYNIDLSNENIKQIPIAGLKDDNYLINIWEGDGISYTVNPYCHILKTNESFIDLLGERSQASAHKNDAEASAITKHSLFDVLPRFGKIGGEFQSEDKRDMLNDYRYPHEWFMTWVIASKMLNNNPKELIKLAEEVQYSSNHLVGFEMAINKMAVKPSAVADAMNIDTKSFEQMQSNMLKIQNSKAKQIFFRGR